MLLLDVLCVRVRFEIKNYPYLSLFFCVFFFVENTLIWKINLKLYELTLRLTFGLFLRLTLLFIIFLFRNFELVVEKAKDLYIISFSVYVYCCLSAPKQAKYEIQDKYNQNT